MSNITRHPKDSSINWIPPFSLNLTYVEPDVVYCVDVFNITCGKEDLLVRSCSVTEPNYVNMSILKRADLFEISVTPKSNVPGTEVGIRQTIKGMIVILLLSVRCHGYNCLFILIERSLFTFYENKSTGNCGSISEHEFT